MRKLALLILCSAAFAQKPNLPNDTTASGDILFTERATPATPASGKSRFYIDSTLHLPCSIDSTGTVHCVGSGSGTVTTTGSPASGNLTKFSGSTSITNGDLSGDVTTSGTLAATLANSGVSAGSCGDTTHSCSITVDAKGRVTAQSNNAISAASATNPALAGIYCRDSGTFSCSSRFNVIANKDIIALCGDFTNGAGAGTPSFSDTLSLTWTQIATAFQSGQSRQVTAWKANPGSTTGADTFTCGNSVSISFGGIGVFMINGTSTVDVSTSATGNNVNEALSLTTTADNDAVFVVAEYGGSATLIDTNAFQLYLDGAQAVAFWYKGVGKAGTYYSQVDLSANHAILAFALK